MQTTDPLLTPGDREIIHDLDSPRALILHRLAMRDDAWALRSGIVPGGPPQPTEFGRATWMDEERADALDQERIQEPPSRPRPWRSLGIVLALLPVVIVALILLGIHDGVIWFAERIRLIVRGMA